MSQNINYPTKVDLNQRLELFDKCIQSLEVEIKELEKGTFDSSLDLIGSYAIKDEFRTLISFINGPLLSFQEAISRQTKYNENQRQQSQQNQSIQSLLVNSSLQYEATSSNASANRNTQAQPQSIAQVQVGSSQSMLLQPVSMGQHQQPIQWMQPLSQGTSSIPPIASSPYVGSSSGTSSLLGQDINSVATLGAQIPVAAASTQWMNLTTLTGASAKSSPIVGGLPAYPNDLRAHAPTSIPSIPVHTATPSGAYMGPATTSASTANFNQSSLPPPLSIPISTPASIPLSTPILTSLPNVRPVMTSSPALPVQSSLPALSPVVLAQAPVTTSNAPISNAVDPVIKPVSDSVAIDDDTQNSPRRLTRHRQKVDNTETPVNVPSEPTSSGKQPPEAMSTRRGAIAQPPPVKNTPTGTQGVASALTKRLTSPPTVVKKRGAEVVSTASKASAADTSDSIRRSKRISN